MTAQKMSQRGDGRGIGLEKVDRGRVHSAAAVDARPAAQRIQWSSNSPGGSMLCSPGFRMVTSPSAASLSVDVVSDVVCPWCYIGKRKLERALEELKSREPALDPVVRWHPFELNPDLPAEGIARSAYLEAKFGSDRAAHIYTRVRAAGESVGIAFEFDRIVRQPNTRDAHRLIAWAQQEGDAAAAVEVLFRAYFVEGRSLSDPAELAGIAHDAGLDRAAAAALLASDRLRAEVETEYREAQAAGISAVPFFIFNGRTAVSGAHDPPTLLEAIAAARA
jgi:predicted DsbA family dithiol-disulfide isomerase